MENQYHFPEPMSSLMVQGTQFAITLLYVCVCSISILPLTTLFLLYCMDFVLISNHFQDVQVVSVCDIRDQPPAQRVPYDFCELALFPHATDTFIISVIVSSFAGPESFLSCLVFCGCCPIGCAFVNNFFLYRIYSYEYMNYNGLNFLAL